MLLWSIAGGGAWVMISAAHQMGVMHHDPSTTRTLVAAIAAAGVLTIVLVPYREYRFQFDWAWISATVVYLLFLALGGLAGWGGFAVARSVGWHPVPESQILTGIIYGTFGLAVVRVRLDKLPTDAGDALTPLGVVGDWLKDILDVQVPRAVRRRLGKMPPPELAQYVSLLFTSRAGRDKTQLRAATRKQLGQQVTTASVDILGGSEVAQIQGRSSLITFGEEWVLKYKFDRPRKLKT